MTRLVRTNNQRFRNITTTFVVYLQFKKKRTFMATIAAYDIDILLLKLLIRLSLRLLCQRSPTALSTLPLR